MVSASLCRRRLQRWHRSLRPRQDGEGEHQQSRPYHLPRRPPHPAQTQSRHQTNDRHTECHGTVFGAEYVSLLVRQSNRATFDLYTETLGYKIHNVEAKHYAVGEMLMR